MSNREVTEFDLRAPEFQHPSIKPQDYEFRDDGKVVRKDRWETGLRRIAGVLGWSREEWEIDHVVAEVKKRLDCGIDGDEEYESWFPIQPRADGVTTDAAPEKGYCPHGYKEGRDFCPYCDKRNAGVKGTP
jgi:hypothetical protein